MQKLRAYDYYMTECEVGFLRNNLQVTHFVFDKVRSLSDIQHDVFEGLGQVTPPTSVTKIE